MREQKRYILWAVNEVVINQKHQIILRALGKKLACIFKISIRNNRMDVFETPKEIWNLFIFI